MSTLGLFRRNSGSWCPECICVHTLVSEVIDSYYIVSSNGYSVRGVHLSSCIYTVADGSLTRVYTAVWWTTTARWTCRGVRQPQTSRK
ncbi:hypothetical protein CBL_00163, partial [Carabus blaptoides fortunei]